MERRKKIDESLKERHGILRLLERLKSEHITYDEIEEIGIKLRKSGKRALSPLVRKLWRERSGDLISRYAYLLDFFDDEIWLDQLIRMTLHRRDLEEDGKAALLAALEGYGVDVSAPPFSSLLAEPGGPLHATLPGLLDKGEEGLVSFVEDILFADREVRRAVIRELPRVNDLRVLKLIGTLLRIRDPEINHEAISALGRIRDKGSVSLLQGLLDVPDGTTRDLAGKSLRRLSFLGIDTASPSPDRVVPPNFHKTCVGPFDGAGYRTLWLCRRDAYGTLSSIVIQIHEIIGITAVWGSNRLEVQECDRIWEDLKLQDGVVEIDPVYAMVLTNDAISRNLDQGLYLPAEFYVKADIFHQGEITPKAYSPDLKAHDLSDGPIVSRMTANSASLMDDEYFSAWFIAVPRVYDFAEEWMELEKYSGRRDIANGVESLVERFCLELVSPEIEKIRMRLIFTADLMRRTGRDRFLVNQVLAIALSLQNSFFPLHKHPFFRRFALESMDLARDALSEGYDPRELGDFEEEWE